MNSDLIWICGIIGHSGEGIGGILSVIGSALASGAKPTKNESGNIQAPTPNSFASLLMTGSDTNILDHYVNNLRATNFPESKVGLGLLDCNKKVQPHMKNQFDFIGACDCAKDSIPPSQLAKVVAYSLKSTQASFLYVGSERQKKNIESLSGGLKDGYNMNTILKDMVLERIQLVPAISVSVDDAKIQSKESALVECEDIKSNPYTALVCYHDQVEKEVCDFALLYFNMFSLILTYASAR